MEEMKAERMAAGDMNDNTSSVSSSNSSIESVGENPISFTPLFYSRNDPSNDADESSRSSTPLSDSSNDPSYDAGESSDAEDVGAIFFYEM